MKVKGSNFDTNLFAVLTYEMNVETKSSLFDTIALYQSVVSRIGEEPSYWNKVLPDEITDIIHLGSCLTGSYLDIDDMVYELEEATKSAKKLLQDIRNAKTSVPLWSIVITENEYLLLNSIANSNAFAKVQQAILQIKERQEKEEPEF